MSSYIGGVRWRFWNASWPFARLEVEPDRLHIGATLSALKRVVPDLSFQWNDLERVERVRGILPSKRNAGVSFTLKSGRAAIFWCTADAATAVLNEVAQRVSADVVHPTSRRVVL